ncbi:Proton-coupled amino acid transporter-like protein CG1139 [Gryllus bimaculatus]|nr:Proton-coupled amino acid transporter-like protein CG1139 [Gryllus bimaculatus]
MYFNYYFQFLQVVDMYWKEVNVRFYMLMILVPLILLNYVRNLKLLAPFSTLANIITFVGLGITLYYLFNNIPNPADRDMVGSIRTFPLFIGTTLFALEAVGVNSKSHEHLNCSGAEENHSTMVDFLIYGHIAWSYL